MAAERRPGWHVTLAIMSSRAPLHSIRIRLIIAASALAVLVAGYLLRPQVDLPPPAVEEQPSPILREVVERREAVNVFAALQQTARAVLPATARLTLPPRAVERWSDWRPQPAANPARYAVPVGERRLLGAAADLSEGSSVQVHVGDGRTVTALVITRFPNARLALLVLDGGDPLPLPNPAPVTVAAGDVVVGVAPGADGIVVVPMVVAEVRRGILDVTSDIDRYLGMPVFTAAGVWVGIVAAGPDGVRVVRADDVLSASSVEGPVERTLGVSLRYAGDGGAGTGTARPIVVEDVAPDGVAEAAGLRAADVILTIDGEEPADLEAAAAALAAERTTPLAVRVRRGGRTAIVRLPPVAGTAP
jgi:hypothetical protein